MWPKATIGAEGPQPAKRACLPQGLALGARSAPFTLVYYIVEHDIGMTGANYFVTLVLIFMIYKHELCVMSIEDNDKI